MKYDDVTASCSTNAASDNQSSNVALLECYYQCENCDWTAQKDCGNLSVTLSLLLHPRRLDPNKAVDENHITVDTTSSSSSSSFTRLDVLLRTATERCNTIIRQRQSLVYDQSINLLYNNITEQWKLHYQQEKQHQPTTVLSHSSSSSIVPKKKRTTQSDWSLPQLEAKLNSTVLATADDNIDPNTVGHDNIVVRKNKSIHDILLRNEKETVATMEQQPQAATEEQEWDHLSLFSYQLQLLANPKIGTVTKTTTTSNVKEDSDSNNNNDTNCWYPLPIPFIIRHSRRSKAEVLLYNRPGIILKPKLNPLDGDTSILSGQYGQWFRKDSSAIYVVPQVQVVQQRHFPMPHMNPSSNTNDTTTTTSTATIPIQHTFLIQVTNPTLGNIRFRLSPSSYGGEWDYWNEESAFTNTATAATTSNPILRHVLVDTLHRTILDQLNILTTFNTMTTQPTKTVELLPAEDLIIESGRTSHTTGTSSNQQSDATTIPLNILNWDPTTADSTTEENSIRFIGQNSSTAWFELTTTNTTTNNTITTGSSATTSGEVQSYGIPIALEIELGNGSWESSLIPIQNENDMVAFNIVLVWTQ
jgi:hypothetical protein